MAENKPEIMCACTKGPCNGECREKHLNRKRTFLDRCPAAYDKKEKRSRRRDDDDYYDEE